MLAQTTPLTHITEVTIALITSITTLVVLLVTQMFQWFRDRRRAGVAVTTLDKATEASSQIQQGVAVTVHQLVQLHERVAALATHTESLWPVAQQWQEFMSRWDDLPEGMRDAQGLIAYLSRLRAEVDELERRVGVVEAAAKVHHPEDPDAVRPPGDEA